AGARLVGAGLRVAPTLYEAPQMVVAVAGGECTGPGKICKGVAGIVGDRRHRSHHAGISHHALLELVESLEAVGTAEVVPISPGVVAQPADDVPVQEVSGPQRQGLIVG